MTRGTRIGAPSRRRDRRPRGRARRGTSTPTSEVSGATARRATIRRRREGRRPRRRSCPDRERPPPVREPGRSRGRHIRPLGIDCGATCRTPRYDEERPVVMRVASIPAPRRSGPRLVRRVGGIVRDAGSRRGRRPARSPRSSPQAAATISRDELAGERRGRRGFRRDHQRLVRRPAAGVRTPRRPSPGPGGFPSRGGA